MVRVGCTKCNSYAFSPKRIRYKNQAGNIFYANLCGESKEHNGFVIKMITTNPVEYSKAFRWFHL